MKKEDFLALPDEQKWSHFRHISDYERFFHESQKRCKELVDEINMLAYKIGTGKPVEAPKMVVLDAVHGLIRK